MFSYENTSERNPGRISNACLQCNAGANGDPNEEIIFHLRKVTKMLVYVVTYSF